MGDWDDGSPVILLSTGHPSFFNVMSDVSAPTTPPSPPADVSIRWQVASEFFIDFDKRNKELLAAFFFPKVSCLQYALEVLELTCREGMKT